MGEEKWKVTRHTILSINLSSKRERKALGTRRGSIAGGFHFGMEEGHCFHAKYNQFFSILFEQWKNICLKLFAPFIILVILLGVAHQSCIQVLSVI